MYNPEAGGPPLFRLSATAYSIYSQLSYISVGRLLRPQPNHMSCRGDRHTLNIDGNTANFIAI
jgi:hypothetical protein